MSETTKSKNLVPRLQSAYLVTEVSKKTGNPYTYLQLNWNKKDGIYEQRGFFQGNDWPEIIESLTVPVPTDILED